MSDSRRDAYGWGVNMFLTALLAPQSIYNLPESKLGKNALSLAHDIMAGINPILPAGHIPQNQEQAVQMGNLGNWDNYPFLKSLKVCSTYRWKRLMCCNR